MTHPVVTIVGSYTASLVMKARRLPTPGETTAADSFRQGHGGKGTLQALAAAKLGAQAQLVARLGSDEFGRRALELFRSAGIDTQHVSLDRKNPTGIGMTMIDSAGRSLGSVVGGANLALTRQDLNRAMPAISAAAIVGFQLENPLSTVFYGLRLAHDAGVTTFLEPAPLAPIPADLYACIDVICLNEVEALLLSGIEVKAHESARRAGEWFLQRGAGQAVITLGPQGAVLVTPQGAAHFPAPGVKAVDTSGAGDIFSGVMLAALAEGRPGEEAVPFAVTAASLSTERPGTIESIPTRAEVEQRLGAPVR